MKTVKVTAEYTVFLRNDGRYAVRSAARKWINGDDKVEILKKEGLVKAPEPKAPEPEVAEAADGEAADAEGEAEA